MNHWSTDAADYEPWPRWWRWTVIALATLILCSCRAPGPAPGAKQSAPGGTLPDAAWTGHAADGHTAPVGALPVALTAPWGIPLPQTLVSPWTPPGIEGPWPADEYLHDGGDGNTRATVNRDWDVKGLEMEDTIVHYDTTDGRRLIEPSNRVDIYAPRFAAVRQVTTPLAHQQTDQLIEVGKPVKLVVDRENLLATTAVQPIQPEGQLGMKRASLERLRQGGDALITLLPTLGVESGFLPYENFNVIRFGKYEQGEKPYLAVSVDAAIAWTDTKAVQVVLDGRQAETLTGDQRAQATFTVNEPNNPRLRVIKIASTNVAKPGETVDFTIRFDNLGDQTIGNVTLIDNLTTRLEYIEGSAKSSRTSNFFAQSNEGDSLVLRWEFTDPLPAGEGGLVRFHCKVR